MIFQYPPYPGPSSRNMRGKRKRSSHSNYSSPSPPNSESKQGSLQRKKRARDREVEVEEEDNDEEHSWRRQLMQQRGDPRHPSEPRHPSDPSHPREPRQSQGSLGGGELDLGIDRLLSDQRGRASRSPSGSSRGRASQEQWAVGSGPLAVGSGRNAGNISDGFEIPGFGRGKL